MLERLTGIGSDLPLPELPSQTEDVYPSDLSELPDATETTDEEQMPEISEISEQEPTKSLEEILGLADASVIPEWRFRSLPAVRVGLTRRHSAP